MLLSLLEGKHLVGGMWGGNKGAESLRMALGDPGDPKLPPHLIACQDLWADAEVTLTSSADTY